MSSKKVTRLFDSFKPSNYELIVDLDPAHKSFKGSVVITGRKTGRPSKRLTFHQKGLTITNATVTKHDKKGDEEVVIDRFNTQKSYDELRIHSSSLIYPGSYSIKIEFSGKATDPMNGAYPCYFTHDGKKKHLIATQFESHHAREVFPCVDEPEAKATFDVSILSPDNDESIIANTPVKAETKKAGVRTTVFETTPIMSTYLLAFVHGDIGFKEATSKSGTLVRGYATPDNVKFVDFALETAVKVLDFYEDYFAIPFPLPKIDMIALPDFAAGAMENWGLITYREQCMLVDPVNTSIHTKQYVAMVVAHELAHQWFGNLVTMQWWTDLWLNEGFASWIEYLAVDKIFPDWQMWTQFIADEMQPAFKLDALDNTHPIEVPINHPDEIRSIFDTISYNKGASVIHMLHGYLGADDFRDGLRHYLKEHAYKNTVTTDLWAALEEVSKKPVSEFMHAWTSLPGFPVVSVSQKGKTTEVQQRRFYAVEPAKRADSVWPVPLLTHVEGLQTLDTPSAVLDTALETKLNRGQSGFYRTYYDDAILKVIVPQVPAMDPLDRLGILSDSFETAKSGYSDTSAALELLSSYADEDNASVWDIIATNIGEIRRVMDDDGVRDTIKPLVRNLVAKQLERLGWDDKKTDSYFDKLLRPTILGLASSADEPSVVKEAIARFEAADNPEDIPADLRGIIYTTAARHGDSKTFDKLLGWHNSTDLSEERTTLCVALTSFEQPELYKKALGMILGDDVRRQDAMYWLAYSFGNRFAKREAWEWMQANWGWLEKNLGSDLSFFRTPIYAARSFSNPDFLDEYTKFFEPKSSPSLDRSIKQGAEMLQWQIGWKQRDLAKIQGFLNRA